SLFLGRRRTVLAAVPRRGSGELPLGPRRRSAPQDPSLRGGPCARQTERPGPDRTVGARGAGARGAFGLVARPAVDDRRRALGDPLRSQLHRAAASLEEPWPPSAVGLRVPAVRRADAAGERIVRAVSGAAGGGGQSRLWRDADGRAAGQYR